MRAFCYIQKKYYKWKIDLITDDLFKGEKKNCEIEIVYPENFSLNTLSKKKKYDFLVGCNVDDFKFQLLYKFLHFDIPILVSKVPIDIFYYKLLSFSL